MLVIVPIEVYSAENFAFGIDGHFVVLFETVDQVIRVCLADNFDSKVVDYQVESGGAGDVSEEAGSVACGDVAVIS